MPLILSVFFHLAPFKSESNVLSIDCAHPFVVKKEINNPRIKKYLI